MSPLLRTAHCFAIVAFLLGGGCTTSPQSQSRVSPPQSDDSFFDAFHLMAPFGREMIIERKAREAIYDNETRISDIAYADAMLVVSRVRNAQETIIQCVGREVSELLPLYHKAWRAGTDAVLSTNERALLDVGFASLARKLEAVRAQNDELLQLVRYQDRQLILELRRRTRY